ncbi:hypothetical protein DFH27DRAFT_606288 [Peziza echinospora]|nr:hypothetical protein DFH27DRAFT_606288 [Peziza echinospora]
MDAIRKPWIENGVKKNLEVLTEIRRSRQTKQLKKITTKPTDYIGKHGELSVRAEKRRLVQIIQWLNYRKPNDTGNLSPLTNTCAQVSDKYIMIYAEFTPDCVRDYESKKGAPITEDTAGNIIQLEEFEMFFKGTDGQQFFKNVDFNEQAKALKESAKNTTADGEAPSLVPQLSPPEVTLRIHQFTVIWEKSAGAPPIKLGYPVPVRERVRSILKVLPWVITSQPQPQAERKQTNSENEKHGEKGQKVGKTNGEHTRPSKRRKSKRVLEEDDLDDDAISQMPFATQIAPTVMTPLSKAKKTPAIPSKGLEQTAGKDLYRPGPTKLSASIVSQGSRTDSSKSQNSTGHQSTSLSNGSQSFSVEIETRIPAATGKTKGMRPNPLAINDQKGPQLHQHDSVRKKKTQGKAKPPLEYIGPPSLNSDSLFHPGWEGMTEVTSADVTITKEQKAKLADESSWFKNSMLPPYRNGKKDTIHQKGSINEEIDCIYDLPAPPLPPPQPPDGSKSLHNVESSDSEFDGLSWSSSQDFPFGEVGKDIMPPDSSACQITDQANTIHTPQAVTDMTPEDGESIGPSNSEIKSHPPSESEKSPPSKPSTPLDNLDDEDSDDSPRRRLRRQGASFPDRSSISEDGSPEASNVTPTKKRLWKASTLRSEPESSYTDSSEVESDVEAALMVNPTGMTNVAKYGILRSQNLVIKKKEKVRRRERLSKGLPAESEEECRISEPEPYDGYSSSDEKSGGIERKSQSGTPAAADVSEITVTRDNLGSAASRSNILNEELPSAQESGVNTPPMGVENNTSGISNDVEPHLAAENQTGESGLIDIESHPSAIIVQCNSKTTSSTSKHRVPPNTALTHGLRATRDDSDSDDEIPQAEPRPYLKNRGGTGNINIGAVQKERLSALHLGALSTKSSLSLPGNSGKTMKPNSLKPALAEKPSGLGVSHKIQSARGQKSRASVSSVESVESFPSTNPRQKGAIVQVADTPHALPKAAELDHPNKKYHQSGKGGKDVVNTKYASDDEEIIPATAFSSAVQKAGKNAAEVPTTKTVTNDTDILDSITVGLPTKSTASNVDVARAPTSDQKSPLEGSDLRRQTFAVVIPPKLIWKDTDSYGFSVGSRAISDDAKRERHRKHQAEYSRKRFLREQEAAARARDSQTGRQTTDTDGGPTDDLVNSSLKRKNTEEGPVGGLKSNRKRKYVKRLDFGSQEAEFIDITEMAREHKRAYIESLTSSEKGSVHTSGSHTDSEHDKVEHSASPKSNPPRTDSPHISPAKDAVNNMTATSISPKTGTKAPMAESHGTAQLPQSVPDDRAQAAGPRLPPPPSEDLPSRRTNKFPESTQGQFQPEIPPSSAPISATQQILQAILAKEGIKNGPSFNALVNSKSRYSSFGGASPRSSPGPSHSSRRSSAASGISKPSRKPRASMGGYRTTDVGSSSITSPAARSSSSGSTSRQSSVASRTPVPPAPRSSPPPVSPYRRKLDHNAADSDDDTADGSSPDVIPAKCAERVQRTLVPLDRFSELLSREKVEKVMDYSGIPGRELSVLLPGYNNLSLARKAQLREWKKIYFGPGEVELKGDDEREGEEADESRDFERVESLKELPKERLEEEEWWREEVTPMKKFVKGFKGMKSVRKELL